MNIKSMVENPHPINKKYCSYWDFLLMSYEGGVDYSNSLIPYSDNNGISSLWNLFVNGKKQLPQKGYGNLFLHAKERPEDYLARLNMSYYYNFCAPIIDIYSDHLFKQAIVEDFEEIEDSIKEVKEDIDQQGSSIGEFRKNLSDMVQIYGHAFVIVDSPSVSNTDILTRKDQIENRAFPYLTIHSPQNIINWALDEFGNPYWVLVREIYDGNKDPMKFNKDESRNCLYRLWTRDEWYLYDDNYKLIGNQTHGVGEVPIVCAVDKKSKKARNFLGISSIADIAFIARDIYNSSSELRQILRDQTFSFLALQGSSDEYDEVTLGTGKGLLYPAERNAPQYVSPSGENADKYFTHIDRQVAKIFQLAKLEGGSVQQKDQSAVAQSGVSKAWDFNQTNSSLSSKSSSLEDAEMRIWSLFAKWEGKTFTGTIQYPDEFSVSSLMEDLDEAEKEAKLDLGRTFNIEVKKAIIKKKFPRKSDDDIESMVKEIEQETDRANAGTSMSERLRSLINNTATGGQNRGL